MIHCKIILDAKNNNSSNELAPDIIGQERTVTSQKNSDQLNHTKPR